MTDKNEVDNEKLIKVINKVGTIETANYINSLETENEKLKALARGLSDRHRWHPHGECICDWHEKAKEVEELKKQLSLRTWQSHSRGELALLHGDMATKLEAELAELKQLNEKYREVIEFYADPYVFDSELMGDDDDCQIDMDKPWRCYSGRRARQALEDKFE